MSSESDGDWICPRCGGLHVRNVKEVLEFTVEYLKRAVEPCTCQECGCNEVQENLSLLLMRLSEPPSDDPWGGVNLTLEEGRARWAERELARRKK